MLDARRFFSNVPPHMLPREKIDTWLAIKQRAHAKRAVVQAMSKEDMKKKLQQRSEVSGGARGGVRGCSTGALVASFTTRSASPAPSSGVAIRTGSAYGLLQGRSHAWHFATSRSSLHRRSTAVRRTRLGGGSGTVRPSTTACPWASRC